MVGYVTSGDYDARYIVTRQAVGVVEEMLRRRS